MSAQDLWDKLDALPWPGPWVAHTFEIDCPCPNGEHCGDTHDCAEVEDRTAYPASPEKPAEPGHGQCVVQINTPGLETFAKPCAEFIAAARNELPAIRARLAELEAQLLDDAAKLQEGIALVAAKAHERLRATAEALARYGEHDGDCAASAVGAPGDARCTCGYDDAVANPAPPLRPRI